MRSFLGNIAFAATLISAPTALLAQDFTITAGASLTTQYLSNGLPQSRGPAFQPFVELDASGFYVGAWASNTSRTLYGARGELDLYLGYRNEVGTLSYDVGYTRYFNISPNSNCCGEAHLEMTAHIDHAASVGARVAYDPSARVLNSRINGGYEVTDQFGLEASIGKINRGGHRYWHIGSNFEVMDSVVASAGWHDTNIDKGRAVLSVSYSLNLR